MSDDQERAAVRAMDFVRPAVKEADRDGVKQGAAASDQNPQCGIANRAVENAYRDLKQQSLGMATSGMIPWRTGANSNQITRYDMVTDELVPVTQEWVRLAEQRLSEQRIQIELLRNLLRDRKVV